MCRQLEKTKMKTKLNVGEKHETLIEDKANLDDVPVNIIDLKFSKEKTNKYDRKKVERFWNYFRENDEIGHRLLKESTVRDSQLSGKLIMQLCSFNYSVSKFIIMHLRI